MVDEIALRNAFGAVKRDISELREGIKDVEQKLEFADINERLNDVSKFEKRIGGRIEKIETVSGRNEDRLRKDIEKLNEKVKDLGVLKREVEKLRKRELKFEVAKETKKVERKEKEEKKEEKEDLKETLEKYKEGEGEEREEGEEGEEGEEEGERKGGWLKNKFEKVVDFLAEEED